MLLGLVCLSVALRLMNIGGKSLWVDEGASMDYATESIGTIVETRQDPHHPAGYYALLHFVFSESLKVRPLFGYLPPSPRG